MGGPQVNLYRSVASYIETTFRNLYFLCSLRFLKSIDYELTVGYKIRLHLNSVAE